MLVAASAIIAPVESFGIAIFVASCYLKYVVLSIKTTLINVIVHDNNTNTLPQRGKQKSATNHNNRKENC